MDKKVFDKKLNSLEASISGTIGEGTFQRTIQELKSIIEKEDNTYGRAERVLAKLYYTKGNIKEAIKYYEKSLAKDDVQLNTYLNLCKCFSIEGGFIKAKKNLDEYTEKALASDKEVNVHILKRLMSNIVDGRKDDIEVTLEYMSYDIEDFNDEDLMVNFLDFQILYNQSKYSECYEKIKELGKIVLKNKYPMDFSLLEIMIFKLKNRQNQEIEKEEDVHSKLISAKKANDPYLMNIFLGKNLQNGNTDYNLMYSTIYTLIKSGYTEECKKYIPQLPKTPNNAEILRVLNQAIINKEEYHNYEQDQVDYIEQTILYSKYYSTRAEYENAYNILSAAYYVMPATIFLYYMGKALYFMGRPFEAIECFEEYAKTGTDKLYKTYMRLIACYYQRFHVSYDQTSMLEKEYIQRKINRYVFFKNMLNNLYGRDQFTKHYHLVTEVDGKKKVINSLFSVTGNEYIDVIRDEYVNGSLRKAEEMFEALEKIEDKTETEEEAFSTIKYNKPIYICKRNYR